MTLDLTRIGPDAFRRNAFAVLGLATDVGRARIRRAANSLITAVSMDDGPERLREQSIGGLAAIADEPALREAAQRLQEPETRLLDELLWFRTDEAEDCLEALRGKDQAAIAQVVEDWHDAERCGEGDGATHNLAVYYHALAVELENRIDSELAANRGEDGVLAALRDDADLCWSLALLRWRRVLASQGFWEWTQDRIAKIGAGRLSATTVGQLREQLPAALLAIPGRLMVRSFERRRTPDAERLRRVLTDGAASRDHLTTALNALAQPSIGRLRTLTETFGARIEGTGKEAGRLTDEFIGEADPLLALADWLVGASEPVVRDLHDAFARGANRGQIIHWDATDQDDAAFCARVLRHAIPHARAPDLKKTLEGNLESVICHFCPKKPENPRSAAHSVQVPMYRITAIKLFSEEYLLSVLQRVDLSAVRALVEVLRSRGGPESVSYSRQTITVPRCRECGAKGRTRGEHKHRFVQEELTAGWKFGNEPSQEEIATIHVAIERMRGI